MKKYYFLIIVALILGLVLTGCSLLSNVGQVPTSEQSGISDLTKSLGVNNTYGEVTLNNWGKGNFSDVWDLTQCDLTLSYTIDMSTITNAGWAVTEVGLREVGASNIDPNLKGGWMQSNYIDGTSNPDSLKSNDMHLLSKHGWSFQKYDATNSDTLITPYWSGNNYGFWFDRDGVDEWQAQMWGMDGTYNTGGIYEIVITYHAIDLNTGTMFATINGVVQQGLYIGGWKDAEPEFYPAGRSFEGDMTQMQVFYGRGGGGGTVTISDITVDGCPFWDECTVDLIAGQNEVAGMVMVDDDGDNLLITYETIGDWQMTKTHLYVGKTDPKLLTSAPGQFPYSEPLDTPTSHTYTIPIADIDSYNLIKGKKWIAADDPGIGPGDQIYIASHAEVIRPIIDCYEPVWQIGDVEENKLDNPCDEFNHPTLVYGTQSFYVGTTPTIEFPWISRLNKNYAPTINIYFNANAEMLLGGKFLFSWSPGGSGNETIKILLDGIQLDTVNRSGTVVGGWWDNKERFIDSIDVPAIDVGDHVLTIEVLSGDGLVWDWLRLEAPCFQEESAWAEGDQIRPDKNWAMYFEFPCN